MDSSKKQENFASEKQGESKFLLDNSIFEVCQVPVLNNDEENNTNNDNSLNANKEEINCNSANSNIFSDVIQVKDTVNDIVQREANTLISELNKVENIRDLAMFENHDNENIVIDNVIQNEDSHEVSNIKISNVSSIAYDDEINDDFNQNEYENNEADDNLQSFPINHFLENSKNPVINQKNLLVVKKVDIINAGVYPNSINNETNYIPTSRKISKVNHDIKEPFKHGWKRIVKVKNLNQENPEITYVKYISPLGKQILNYKNLKKSYLNEWLTKQNFTFEKIIIGINDPSKEVIEEVTVQCKPAPDLTKPEYLEPFKFGWKRVGVVDKKYKGPEANSRLSAVYYVSPEGEKMFSFSKLAEAIAGTGMTMDNFTYYRGLLNIDDPDKEIIKNRNPPQVTTTDVTSPDYLEPFKFGWKRIGMKNRNPENQDEELEYVYYLTPNFVKVHHASKILSYMLDIGLAVKHFTFAKKPIGVNNKDVEIIQEPDEEPINLELDINDPNLREPFKYGWVRTVVKAKPCELDGDDLKLSTVYYTTPEGEVIKNIGKLTKFIANTSLTLKNFAFQKVILGINDPEKEFIRGHLNVKTEIDLSNPEFRKPFDFGWKRIGVIGKSGDVSFYYLSPKGEKIYTYTKLSEALFEYNNLTIDNFTYHRGAIGINDPEKEYVRERFSESKKEIDVTNPLYQEPFKYGWKRFVVEYHDEIDEFNEVIPGGIKKIYYLSPKNERANSCTDVNRFLSKIKTKLTVDNFTFYKKAIGVDKSKEIIEKTVPRSRIKEEPKKEMGIKRKNESYNEEECIEDSFERSLSKIISLSSITIIPKERASTNANSSKKIKHNVKEQNYPLKNNISIEDEKRKRELFKQKMRYEDMNNPKFREPFKYGWKRVVVKNTNEDVLNKEEKVVYVYYISPNGNRLSSYKTLEESIYNTQLSLENFTFKRQILGINDPEKETIINQLWPMHLSPAEFTSNQIVNYENNEVYVPDSKYSYNGYEFVSTDSVVDEPQLKCSNVKNKNLNISQQKNPKKIENTIQLKKNKKLCLVNNRLISKQTQSFFESCKSQFNINLYIFQYLEFNDLINVQKVCKMWRCLGNDTSLWKTVNINNKIIIKNWYKFADVLYKHNTQCLDLRKVCSNEIPKDDWSKFVTAISGIKTLTEINLCQVPNFVIRRIIAKCQQLTMLRVSNCKLSDFKQADSNPDEIYNEFRLNLVSGVIESIDNIVL